MSSSHAHQNGKPFFVSGLNRCEIAAPYGLDDLLSLILRPTPRFRKEQQAAWLDRVRIRQRLTVWPRLRMKEN
jgi:hypothetical protein